MVNTGKHRNTLNIGKYSKHVVHNAVFTKNSKHRRELKETGKPHMLEGL